MQPRVDDLKPGIAQRPRDNLGCTIVAVEAGFGDEDADLAVNHGVRLAGSRPEVKNERMAGQNAPALRPRIDEIDGFYWPAKKKGTLTEVVPPDGGNFHV